MCAEKSEAVRVRHGYGGVEESDWKKGVGMPDPAMQADGASLLWRRPRMGRSLSEMWLNIWPSQVIALPLDVHVSQTFRSGGTTGTRQAEIDNSIRINSWELSLDDFSACRLARFSGVQLRI